MKTVCPVCGYPITASTCIDGPAEATPEPDDATVCIACASLLIFTDDLDLRATTPEEKAELIGNPIVDQAVQGIVLLRDHDPAWPHGPGRPA